MEEALSNTGTAAQNFPAPVPSPTLFGFWRISMDEFISEIESSIA
jgi:hypothetical protein